MFRLKPKKPRERFYLLPGQGGSNYRRKQQVLMRWTICVAFAGGLILAFLMWRLARPQP